MKHRGETLPGRAGGAVVHCLDTYTVAMRTKTHCLELGGPHARAPHQRALDDCIDACRTAAAMMLRGSELAGSMRKVCAEACEACASSCRAAGEDGQMRACAQACESCAEACRA